MKYLLIGVLLIGLFLLLGLIVLGAKLLVQPYIEVIGVLLLVALLMLTVNRLNKC